MVGVPDSEGQWDENYGCLESSGVQNDCKEKFPSNAGVCSKD